MYCLHRITSSFERVHDHLYQSLCVEDFPELSLQLLESRVRLAIDTVAEELQNSQ